VSTCELHCQVTVNKLPLLVRARLQLIPINAHPRDIVYCQLQPKRANL